MHYTELILLVVQFLYYVEQGSGHGYLAEPPARSSAWMFDSDFRQCCIYYDHAQMSCGGTYHQWTINKGKCSICGEPYDRQHKLFGIGDSMYLGKIVRTYPQGSIINVTVVLTANHLGFFEFRICNVDSDPEKDATQDCLNLNVLKTTGGFTQYQVASNYSVVHLQLVLPPRLVCNHCVFQWRYQTGNSWGVSNGKACLGCGRENEEFYGCSDITIGSNFASTNTTKIFKKKNMKTTKWTMSTIASTSPITTAPVTTAATTTTKSTTMAVTITTKVSNCTSTMTFSQSFDITSVMGKYCQDVCSSNCAPDNFTGNELRYYGCIDTCSKLCICKHIDI